VNVIYDPRRGRWWWRLGLLAAALRIWVSDEAPISPVQALLSRPPARESRVYRLLSETGLYSDIASKTLAPGVVGFTPAYELWSDATAKARWIALPPGTRIDSSEIDHFRFPVGTRAWKEFRRGDQRLETRLIERTGPGANDYWMGAFVWDADGADAVFVEPGADDVLGTDHDVPAASRCASCHGAEPGRILGFSAVQLAPSLLGELAATGQLSQQPPAAAAPLREASSAARAALGYLHANCGHCHSRSGLGFREVDLLLHLDFDTPTAEASETYETAVARRMQRPGDGPLSRIEPGRPDRSGLIARLRSRAPNTAMPPLGTEHVDVEGLRVVSAWIAGLRAMPAVSLANP
jgi:hypothetical protein